MKQPETFGERVRLARLRLELGVNDVDRLMGKSTGYTSRFENGERGSPRNDNLKKLAKALEVDLAWLVMGIGPGPAQPQPKAPAASLAFIPPDASLDDAAPALRDALEQDAIAPQDRVAIPRLFNEVGQIESRRLDVAGWVAKAAVFAADASRTLPAPVIHDGILEPPARTVEPAPREEFETFAQFVQHFGPGAGLSANEIAEVSRDAAATGWKGLTPELARRYLLERRDRMRAQPKIHVRARDDEPPADARAERQRLRDEQALRARVVPIVVAIPKTKRPRLEVVDAFIEASSGKAFTDKELPGALAAFVVAQAKGKRTR